MVPRNTLYGVSKTNTGVFMIILTMFIYQAAFLCSCSCCGINYRTSTYEYIPSLSKIVTQRAFFFLLPNLVSYVYSATIFRTARG